MCSSDLGSQTVLTGFAVRAVNTVCSVPAVLSGVTLIALISVLAVFTVNAVFAIDAIFTIGTILTVSAGGFHAEGSPALTAVIGDVPKVIVPNFKPGRCSVFAIFAVSTVFTGCAVFTVNSVSSGGTVFSVSSVLSGVALVPFVALISVLAVNTVFTGSRSEERR